MDGEETPYYQKQLLLRSRTPNSTLYYSCDGGMKFLFIERAISNSRGIRNNSRAIIIEAVSYYADRNVGKGAIIPFPSPHTIEVLGSGYLVISGSKALSSESLADRSSRCSSIIIIIIIELSGSREE